MALWPDPHDTFLRDRLAEGMSTAKAADALNTEFRTRYTRNACIGRAVRQDMPRNRSKSDEARPEPKKPPEKIDGKARRTWFRHRQLEREGIAVVTPKPKPDLAAMRCVEVEPLNLSLIELTDETCKWPYGDRAPFVFCGNPSAFGSYCGAHYALSVGRDA